MSAHPPGQGPRPTLAPPPPPETPTGLPPTVVHALHDQAARQTHRPALWRRRGRSRVPTSWHDYARGVRRFGVGLARLGLEPGERVALQASNREEWAVSALGALAAGGVPVGLHTTLPADRLGALLGHCGAAVVVVEDADGLARLQGLRRGLPGLRHVVVLDPPSGALPEGVLAWGDVTALGTNQDEGPYWDRVNALRPEALAAIVYTTGTTGRPKGVMLSHHNLVWTAARLARTTQRTEDDTVLCHLPLCHVAEQAVSLYGTLLVGGQVHFPGAPEGLLQDLRDVRPTLFLGVPRVWEALRAAAEEGTQGQAAAQQKVLAWARTVGLDRNRRVLAHERVPGALEAQFQAARRLVFEPLKARLGLDRARFLASTGSPMDRELLERFASLDLVVRESYGQVEVTGPTAVSTLDATVLGLLGRPMPGLEVRIAPDGEVLVRGPNVCLGYWEDPDATARLLPEDGWLHTGDLGRLDAEGFLQLIGRKAHGRRRAPHGP